MAARRGGDPDRAGCLPGCQGPHRRHGDRPNLRRRRPGASDHGQRPRRRPGAGADGEQGLRLRHAGDAETIGRRALPGSAHDRGRRKPIRRAAHSQRGRGGEKAHRKPRPPGSPGRYSDTRQAPSCGDHGAVALVLGELWALRAGVERSAGDQSADRADGLTDQTNRNHEGDRRYAAADCGHLPWPGAPSRERCHSAFRARRDAGQPVAMPVHGGLSQFRHQ